MSMAEEDLRRDLKAFLAGRLKVPESKLEDGTYFTSDLGLDSVRSLELICDVEERYRCRIPDAEVKSMATVADMLVYLERHGARNRDGEAAPGE